VRQTKLPLAQSLVAGTEFALVGNCPMTTSGLGIAPQDALGLIQVAQSPAEIEQLQQWFREHRQVKPCGFAVLDRRAKRLAQRNGGWDASSASHWVVKTGDMVLHVATEPSQTPAFKGWIAR
jgi:hypothetical protein